MLLVCGAVLGALTSPLVLPPRSAFPPAGLCLFPPRDSKRSPAPYSLAPLPLNGAWQILPPPVLHPDFFPLPSLGVFPMAPAFPRLHLKYVPYSESVSRDPFLSPEVFAFLRPMIVIFPVPQNRRQIPPLDGVIAPTCHHLLVGHLSVQVSNLFLGFQYLLPGYLVPPKSLVFFCRLVFTPFIPFFSPFPLHSMISC